MIKNLRFSFNPFKEGLNQVLGDLEKKIIEILWEKGESTVREILDSLPHDIAPSYSTVITVTNRLAKKGEKIVTVDSRFDILKYCYVTAATPNTEEVEWALNVALNENNIKHHGQKILKQIQSNGLLITRGKEGMTLFEKNGDITEIDIYGTDEVADVTGAGDTVISTFTLALAAKASMKEAARLANYAGGIVVMKSGTATVTTEEIWNAIDNE